VRSPRTAASATFALNAAECVRRVLFVIFWFPLPALCQAQTPAAPLIAMSKFPAPPLTLRQHSRLLPNTAAVVVLQERPISRQRFYGMLPRRHCGPQASALGSDALGVTRDRFTERVAQGAYILWLDHRVVSPVDIDDRKLVSGDDAAPLRH
jgi:hypothetical protein